MLSDEVAEKKAELINYGKIYIPKDFALPYYPSRSTAGPGAGKPGLVLGFNGTRVKLHIVRDDATIFSLVRKKKREKVPLDNETDATEPQIRRCIQGAPYQILKNGELFLNDVSLEPTLMHAPGQAFINITSDCIYNCSFCVSPDLSKKPKECSVDRWIELILAHAKNRSLEAVAITSGVAESPHKTVLDMVKIIKAIREKLPEIPIGAEPYLTSNDDVDLLYNAGATELKINLETPNRELFNTICPGLDYDGIIQALLYSTSVFGRNQVCSNLIIGLGETDDEILSMVETLAAAGVVATLRAIRVNEFNEPKLTNALGFTPEPVPTKRLILLAQKHKEILDNHGLSTTKFKTMCHRCKSCDIVPQQDV
jgi:biotin synthase-related radical SAM superfamily protein